jgi:hypothetical protein
MIQIDFSREELEAICRRRAVKRLALFGSVLRDDFGPTSDVDVIVEFRDDFEGKQIYKIYDELTELFGGHKIDLVEVEFLHPRMKAHVLSHTEELYAT